MSALLSEALVALTIELDNETEHRLPHRTTNYGPDDQGGGAWLVSLAMFENCLRFVTDEPASRGKVARLTPAGRRAQHRYLELLGAVEDRWTERFGGDTIGALRESLEVLAVGADGRPAPLFEALEPYPDNWRALVRPPRTLPHYPMVLHRGGYPDGS